MLRRLSTILLLCLAMSSSGAVIDLGGGEETLHVREALAMDTVLTNGTFIATNHQFYLSFSTGVVTVASQARLVFPAVAGKSVVHNFASGRTELCADGGEIELNSWREEDRYSHNWAYGAWSDVTAVLAVRNDGFFHYTKPGGPVLARYYFVLGCGGQYAWDSRKPEACRHAPYGVLLGIDSPTRGFAFEGRLCVGWQARAGVYCTNTLFRAENIVFGGVVPQKGDGYSELVFAAGSTLETKGFCDGITGSSADVIFDRATVRVLPTSADDALNAQTNFFGTGEDRIVYRLDAGGLVFDNNTHEVTIDTTLTGPGGIAFRGTGTTHVTAHQSYNGFTEVGEGTFRPARNLVFAGPVRITDETALEKPPIPHDRNHVRLFYASAFEGLSGRKDATGCHYFTLPGRYGTELHWGRRPGTVIKVR